ncbi:MAG: B12-binding domain-containing protein [Clostridia bacterium]
MQDNLYFTITENVDNLSEEALNLQLKEKPELTQILSKKQLKTSLEDTKYHLNYLSEAIAFDDKKIFINYAKWVKHLFETRNIPLIWFIDSLKAIETTLNKRIENNLVSEYLDAALESIQETDSITTFIDTTTEIGLYARKYTDFLLDTNKDAASKLIEEMTDKGFTVEDIYLNIFAVSQYEVGLLWHNNEISVALEHYCTAATQMIMSQLYPIIFSTEKEDKKALITCTKNELHELGARMVADFLELNGWQTYYIGAQSHYESTIDSIKSYQPDVVAISTTISYHLSEVEELIKLIRSNEDFNNIKIIVGGRPFNENKDLYKKLDADGYAPDAKKAVQVCEEIIKNG